MAYDLTRHDWRSFRLDRLADPGSTGERFRPRDLPAENAADFVRAGIQNMPTTYSVEVVVRAPAARVRAAVSRWGTVEQIDDGSSRLFMTVDGLEWPTMLIGAIGADFEIVGPPELTDFVREWGTRFLRVTG